MIISLASLITGSILCIILFLKGFKKYRDYKLMKETPTTRISDIKDGRVEIKGRVSAIPGKILTAPASGEKCIRYDLKVLGYSYGSDTNSWSTLISEKEEVPFLLTDDSGSIVIDGREADLKLESSFRQQKPSLDLIDVKARDYIRSKKINEMGTLGIMKRDIRVIEKIARPEGQLYVLGNASEQGKLPELASNYLVSRFTVAKEEKMIMSFDDEETLSNNKLSGSMVFFILGSLSLLLGVIMGFVFW